MRSRRPVSVSSNKVIPCQVLPVAGFFSQQTSFAIPTHAEQYLLAPGALGRNCRQNQV